VLVNFNLENDDGQHTPTSVNVSIRSDTSNDRQYNKSSLTDFSRFTHIRPYALISDETTLGFFAVRNDGYITIGVISLEEETYGVYTSCASFRLDETIICAVNHPVENLFVLLNDKREILLFDVSKGRCVVSYTVDDYDIIYMSIHPDGKLVALCGSNSMIHFLDLSNGNVAIVFDCQTVKNFSSSNLTFLLNFKIKKKLTKN
jgi:WD40 repeat protein